MLINFKKALPSEAGVDFQVQQGSALSKEDCTKR
jgi:hypothetical protein